MRLFLILLAVLASATVATASEAKKAEAEKKAKAAIAAFRTKFESEAPKERLAALASLDEVDHALVVDEIGKKGLVDADTEVRQLAARMLGRKRGFTEQSGPYLRNQLGKNGRHPEVQVAIVAAIGRIGYLGARKELTAALRHCREEEYQWVTKEVIRTIERLDDRTMITVLLGLFELRGKSPKRPEPHPTERGCGGGDKGTATARAAYEKKHGKFARRPKGKAETITIYHQTELARAIEKFTGQKFETARDLRNHLKKHYRDFGLKKTDLKRVPKL